MLHIMRHIGIGLLKSIKCDMYMALSVVNVRFTFEIDEAWCLP